MWVDRLGNLVTTVTPEESIQIRCVAITSATKDCPISRQVEKMVGYARNQLAPLLDKLLNTDGTIPSGKNLPEIKEALRKLYFELVNGEEEQVISSEDEETKTDHLEKKTCEKDNKFQKFYPIELELYFKYGPAVLGGEGSAYFLKEAKDIQEAADRKEVSSRCTLCAKNSAELDEQAADKKGKVVLSATMHDSPAAALGASFTLQYEEHLKIERESLHEECKRADTDHERALTDRERANQEDVLYRIKLCQNLIDLAKTEHKKRQYEEELEDLIHSVLQHPRLRALVSEFDGGPSVSTQSLSDCGTSERGISDTASSISSQL
jgi:predicted adenine nucleotide alpha hydrolase (AANH) superfamily ATPase